MSETNTAALEARVAELESQVKVLVARTADDDQTFRELAERINLYSARHEKAISAVDERVAKALSQVIVSVFEHFHREVSAEAVAKISSETIAESLTKKILVVRNANRGEQADIVVRQATPQELRNHPSPATAVPAPAAPAPAVKMRIDPSKLRK